MFAKLVSFVLILIGLWSLFRFVGRLDQAKSQDQSARRHGNGHGREQGRGQGRGGDDRRTQNPRTGAIVEADPMVQCRKCQVFHEAGKRCPDCYSKG